MEQSLRTRKVKSSKTDRPDSCHLYQDLQACMTNLDQILADKQVKKSGNPADIKTIENNKREIEDSQIDDEAEYTQPTLKKRVRKRSRREKSYPCSDCDHICENYQLYRTHIKICDKRLKCPIEGCGKIFNSKCNRTKHVLIHTEEKIIQCHFCAVMFKRVTTLKSHIYAKHSKTEEKMVFKCEECGKVFRFRNRLIEHSSIHTGVREHACTVEGCGKVFRYVICSVDFNPVIMTVQLTLFSRDVISIFFFFSYNA